MIPISAPFGSTTVEVGGGAAAYISKQLSAYAQATYTTNIGGEYVQDIKGIIGLRYSW